MRVLVAAKLGALAAVDTGLVHLHPECILVAGQKVVLAVNVGRPEAVDHVGRIGEHDYRLADGDMNFVGRYYRLVRLRVWIRDFPPPLVAGDLNRYRIF